MQNSLQELPKLSSLNLPWPTDWTAVFGVERPLILEIGFGYGHFLYHLHQTRPNANIIGLEVNNTCLVKAERAIPRIDMSNVRVLHSSAETALHHLFRPTSIQEIHINFPDPWFKDRHAGRRLMQRDTLDAMTSRLITGGKLYLATDIGEYAEMSAELLEATPGLSNTFDSRWVHTLPGRVVTKYERKAKQAGRPCFYFAYRRNNQPVQHPPVVKEQPMPHMIIRSPLNLQEMFAALEQSDLTETTVESGDVRINFKNNYLGSHSLLFDAYVHEPTLDQRVSLALVDRPDRPGEYTLKLGAIGSPRPTDGIHAAVRYLGQRLLALAEGSVILQDKVRS